MANKAVPTDIEGVTLHPRAKQRTNALLRDLEAFGVLGLTRTKSQSDRIRLLATFIFVNLGEGESTTEEVEQAALGA